MHTGLLNNFNNQDLGLEHSSLEYQLQCWEALMAFTVLGDGEDSGINTTTAIAELPTTDPLPLLLDNTEIIDHLQQASIETGIEAGLLNPVAQGNGDVLLYDNSASITFESSNIYSSLPAPAATIQTTDLQVDIDNDDSTTAIISANELAECEPNITRGPDDMYTPRWMRGIGKSKEGLCPVCFENGVVNWKRMKCSAYWYHLNYFHGISSLTGQPFPKPLNTRVVQDNFGKKNRQGLCGECNRWVNIDSPRKVRVNVPEIYWWKHIQMCAKQNQ